MQQVRQLSTAAIRRRSFWWRLLLSCAMVVTAIGTLPSLTQPVAAESADVVISQVYGGGGNSGAQYRNDFIELFNRGSALVDVSSWSVQFASAGNAFGSDKVNLSGTIPAGGYYLIQGGAGTGGTQNLPTPDVTTASGFAMGATSGKVALVTNQATLACGGTANDCFPSTYIPLAGIKDFVGYGTTANNYEGSRAPVPSNMTSVIRGGNGCTEADTNGTDFTTVTAAPRNSSTAINLCGDIAPVVVSTTPANGATNVIPSSNITITFSEAVNFPASAATLTCGTPRTFVLTGGPTTLTINPDQNLPDSQNCTVTITGSAVTDQDGTPQPLTRDYSLSFTAVTPAPGALRIHDIQGAAHVSPRNGTTVTNVPGIVTAKRSNGFYLQEPTPDASDATSEAIFVFTNSVPTVAIGDSVLVSGTVAEFRPGGDATSLTITQIASPSVTPIDTGIALPAPIVIGNGGRVPPPTVIEDDGAGDIETSGTFDPVNDGLDFYESLEGMRVQINDAVAVSPTSNFGSNREIVVLADNGANAGERTARGGVYVRPGDFNPERIFLNDAIGLATLPNVNVGATFPGAFVGVIDYSFNNYKFQITEAAIPAVGSSGVSREATTLPSTAPNQLRIATFNVENLTVGDAQSKFDSLASIINDKLGAPDIIALEEIQDNNGVTGGTGNTTVAADQTYAKLIQAIDVTGPTYEYRQIDPVANEDGGAPGGNIRVGFLFRTDRGLSFAAGSPGCSTCAVGVTGSGPTTGLTANPGRIDPLNQAFTTSRKPLVGQFQFNGRSFFVIANHFNSKGGDEPLFGRNQPPAATTEFQRFQQAQIVNNFVEQLLAADPNAAIAVVGDFNDFVFSAALAELRGNSLVNLFDTLPANERYSYVFQGNSQALDHILVSQSLYQQFAANAAQYDVVHTNAEFWDQDSDHDPQVAQFTLNPPIVVGNQLVTTAEDTPVTITLAATGGGSSTSFTIVTAPTNGTLAANGNGRWLYTPRANYAGPDSFTYRSSDTTQNSPTATVSITVTPVNDPPVAASGSALVNQGQSVEITFSATDVEGSPLTYSIVTAPVHGSLSAISGNKVVYTPTTGYSGPDSLTFRASDGTDFSNIATITIGVVPPPTPTTYTLDVSTSGSGTVTPGTGTYPSGQTATLAATPVSGNVFIGWTVDGVFAGFANPLSITMSANHKAVATFAPAPGFSDVSSGTPYSEAILRLAARGIIRGYDDGTFAPTDTVTRAQSAALIARSVGWDAEDRGNPFSDRCDPANPANCMDDNLWRNVGTLAFYNVARGYGNGEYRPRDGVAHVQVISFITRAMVAKGYWVQATTDDPSIYPNIPLDSPHRLDLVTFVKYAGAIPDRPTGQAWQDWEGPSSRGWYAAVLDRALRSRFATTP